MSPLSLLGTIVIDLDPNVARIGPLLITWHGVFSVIGILATIRLAQVLLPQDGISGATVWDLAGWMILIGLIGARLLFVWENYQQFTGQWLNVFALTEGGISQWGGLFGAMLAAFWQARRRGLSFGRILDAAGPGAMLGLAIGRIGDIINGEHHATVTNLPWAVEYVNPLTLGERYLPVHPEVGYELVWCLLLLAALLPFHQRLRRALPAGAIGLLYLGLYAFGRFWLSYVRINSLVFGLRQAQWASLLMVVIAVVGLAYLLWQRRAAPKSSLATVTA
ncbi:MAG TPA: prolipoprotein diacylglyceryl transferase [Candidatus Dormibacteraeota bacterium]